MRATQHYFCYLSVFILISIIERGAGFLSYVHLFWSAVLC